MCVSPTFASPIEKPTTSTRRRICREIIGSVEVSDDIGFGRVSLHIHFVDTGTVCGYKYFFVSESNDTVYADVRQTGFYEGCLVELEVIYIHASLKSSDKDFAASLVIEKFVPDLGDSTLKRITNAY